MIFDTKSYIRRLEVQTMKQTGMYLHLQHGRKTVDENLTGWGANGPSIGPLKYCHITYLTHINLCGINDDDGTGPMSSDDAMYFYKDLLYYDGMYYGDWELEFFHSRKE